MNIWIRTLKIAATVCGHWDYVGFYDQTPGCVMLTAYRELSDGGRYSVFVSCLDNRRIYMDRLLRTSAGGKVVQLDNFSPMDNNLKFVVETMTRQGNDQTAEADSIAAAHESFEICEAEAFFPSDMRALTAADLADELMYF